MSTVHETFEAEQELIKRFRAAFPTEQDLYLALGYFLAAGLREPEATTAAELVAAPGNDERQSRFVWQHGQVSVLSPENEAREKP